MVYAKHFNVKVTPQSEAIQGSSQVQNSAGGYSWAVDDWKRLDRFLILGSEGGTYYVSERELTKENVKAVLNCIAADGEGAVKRIVEISDSGRAIKNEPALFALALAASSKELRVSRMALAVLPQVARTGTHLFHFLEYVKGTRGWGRSLRTAIGGWYSGDVNKLAYQVVKYRQRDGWTHADALRLSHPVPRTPGHNALYKWIVDGEALVDVPEIVHGYVAAQEARDAKEVAKLIRQYRLPREAIPTQFLSDKVVWEALLEDMPMTALIRNLGNLSKCGLLVQQDFATVNRVCGQLTNADALRKARIHPFAILLALRTYQQGHGFRGSGEWQVVPKVVDALDGVFYQAFGNVEPTGKRIMLALDISGSMWGSFLANSPISCAEGSGAMAMITDRTEPNTIIGMFTTWFTLASLSSRQRLDDVLGYLRIQQMGGTDCALPMKWALQNRAQVDAFVIYTDSETWYGNIHPVQALDEYRRKMGIPARLIVVGMAGNAFTIADPNDAGMLDLVGFDANAPQVISEFAAGRL